MPVLDATCMVSTNEAVMLIKRRAYLNIAVKSFKFLEIDAPAAVSVENICGMSEVVKSTDNVTYSSAGIKISEMVCNNGLMYSPF